MIRSFFAFVLTFTLCFSTLLPAQEKEFSFPWDLETLYQAPAFRWEKDSGPIREIIYSGENYRGNPTEVFAFYASPNTLGISGGKTNRFPAVVLIHGGGGTAFSQWVWMWAKRGYAAIAMDLSGRRPPSPEFDPDTGEFKRDIGLTDRKSRVRLEKGGPEQGQPEKFESIGGEVTDDWPYHTVASVLRAHSLIRSFPEVDSERTAVTGISWGGYSTCLVASVDTRFKAAVPVYGCGFLHQGESVQKPMIDRLQPAERRAEWIARWDPSSHLPNCRVPILFVNGTHDVHYPLDSYQKSFDLVPGEKAIRIEPKMKHSHQAGWESKEIGIFIDSYCKGETPLLTIIGEPKLGKSGEAVVSFSGDGKVKKAQLHYTSESGLRSKREWKQLDAEVDELKKVIKAGPVPPNANTWFFTVTDVRDAMVSSVVKFAKTSPKPPEVKVNEDTTITKIALGSCADQKKKQPIWDAIVAEQPQLFLFLGDNVYADTEDMDEMRATYAKLGAVPGYQKLRSTCPVLPVWDDHDYGVNDGGAEYPMKAESEKVFHEFFNTPADSPTHSYPGTYDVRYFGGEEGKRLQIIMLDTRYFRSKLVPLSQRSADGPYDRNKDPKATILGAAQWKWLEEQLQVPADLRVVMTSIQFLPQDHRWELWENFPHERTRFLKLLRDANTGPVVFVSGDRHMGEISELKTSDSLSPGFPVYELTSSGLTNAGGGRKGEPNRHRVSPTNFQSRNFGMLHIDWDKHQVRMELRDVDGKVVDSYVREFAATKKK